jgi:1-hydroxycarotenoid 3,4-desaturase
MRTPRVAVIGAGMAGLVSALELSARGLDVTVLERAGTPGGKMREVAVGDARIDSGPTVLTMRWVFEQIFSAAGADLSDHVKLTPLEVLARHAWSEDERLDLFCDEQRSADAIGELSGAAEARRYLGFCAAARRTYRTLEGPFMQSERPTPLSLMRSAGLRGLSDLLSIRPFASMWRTLGGHFTDPRLQQLFARYATYCGSCPFLAPATLMLIAHVEREGVWTVEGGMHRLAVALAQLATRRGATLRYGADVAEVTTEGDRVSGVRLRSGETIPADAVVINADIAAVSGGKLGRTVADAAPKVAPTTRSLSAMTWSLVADTAGFPLARHTVFFSRNYAAEFDDIFFRNRMPSSPTVYVCAQDRGNDDARPGEERLLCLINAPANGDSHRFDAAEIEQCEERTFHQLARCGLQVRRQAHRTRVTTPEDFERMFPATGGALYGQASHGWRDSFRRPGHRSRVPGLYLAGGSTHPGPGLPMAALSGRLAASSLMDDLASTSRSRTVAMHGGTSMG